MGKFKIGDKVRRITESAWPEEFGEVGRVYTVSGFCDGCPVIIKGCCGASEDALELLLEEGVKEDTITPKYLTTITTTTHLEQGQVESLLIKTLGINNGADVQWNQDGSVDVVCVSKEV